jgi:hypothetical protein
LNISIKSSPPARPRESIKKEDSPSIKPSHEMRKEKKRASPSADSHNSQKCGHHCHHGSQIGSGFLEQLRMMREMQEDQMKMIQMAMQ